MEQRHVLVEGPNGNVSIGMNPDVEAPPHVEANIEANIEAQPQQRPHMQIYIEYGEINLVSLWIFLFMAVLKFVFVPRSPVFDMFNIVFMAATLYFVHSKKVEGRPIVLLHASCCFLTVPVIAMVYQAWWDAGYFFSLGIHLLATVYFSKMGIRETNLISFR